MKILPVILLLAVAGPWPAFGQARTDPNPTAGPKWESGRKAKPRDPNTRNLEGTVRLPDDSPAPGAVVRIKNLKTLQIRSFITMEDGKYRFDSLSTNIDYEVQGLYKNMASPARTLSVFDNRLDAVVNLKLEPAKKPETAKADEGEKK